MAEKGFGVKEVNLIGPSGTPTITSPNNLNLNAVNVAISTNVSIGGTLSVTGNVSIGGTLTYEDVTNIDSVGLVTAREGVFIPDNKELKIGNTAGSPDTKIFHNGSKTRLVSTVQYDMDADIIDIHNASANSMKARFLNNPVELYYANNKKFETTSSGATVTGTLVATTFSGSGASLTSLPAANLTGTLPAISGANLTNLPVTDPSNSDIQVVYTVTANGSSAYRFGGNGIVSTEDNPDVYLIRGLKYRFINNSGGSHPFQIRESSGGSAYSSGVTNNGASSGNIDFQVPYSAPSRLYYQCTSHGGMVGNLYIRGASGQNTNVGVTTFSGDVYLGNDIYLTDGSSGYEQVEVSQNDIRVELKHIHSEFGVWVRSTSVTDRKNGIEGSGNDLLLYSNTTEKARIESGGGLKFTGQGTSIPVGGILHHTNNNLYVRGGTNGLILGNQDNTTTVQIYNGYIKFETNDGTEKARITSSGHLGIGAGANTNKPLHIYTGSSDSEIRLQTNSGTEQNSYISLRQASGDLDFYTVQSGTNMKFHTANTERLRIRGDGNIGIGNNVADANWKLKIVVPDNSTYQKAFNVTNNSNSDFNILVKTNQTAIGNGTNNPLNFFTNGSGNERVSITSDGYLQQHKLIAVSYSDSRGISLSNADLTTSNFYNTTFFASDSTILDSNGHFVAPVHGIYRLYFRCTTDGSNGNRANVRLRKNGNTINEAYGGANDNNDYMSVSSEIVMELNAGEYLDIQVGQLHTLSGSQHKQVTFHMLG